MTPTLCDRCINSEIEAKEDHGKLVYRQYCTFSVMNFPHMRFCLRYAPEHSQEME